MYVPKIYNLMVLMLTILVMRSIWIKMDERNKTIDWWPFILWFCCSVVFNTYRNTMLENTLSLFTLISIRLLLQVVSHHKKIFLFLALSSGFVFLGFLTKGFVALFPLGFVMVYAVLFKLSFKKVMIYSVLLFIGFGICYYLFITMQPAAQPYFNYYYNQHVIKAVSGNEAITGMGRYFLMGQLLLELSPFILLSFIAIGLNKRYGLKVNHRMILLLLLVGISASFPMFISPKQRTYYLIPSMPYFILGFAMLAQPLVIYFISRAKSSKLYFILPVFFILIAIGYMFIFSQQKEKDADLIADCRKLNEYLPDKTVVETNEDLAMNWRMMAYLSRMGVITPSDKLEGKYVLVRKGDFPGDKIKPGITIELKLFDLYEKR